jgi:hypothetical protein
VLLTATGTVKTKLGESYAKELRKIPLEDNTVGRKIMDFFRRPL